VGVAPVTGQGRRHLGRGRTRADCAAARYSRVECDRHRGLGRQQGGCTGWHGAGEGDIHTEPWCSWPERQNTDEETMRRKRKKRAAYRGGSHDGRSPMTDSRSPWGAWRPLQQWRPSRRANSSWRAVVWCRRAVAVAAAVAVRPAASWARAPWLEQALAPALTVRYRLGVPQEECLG